MKEKNIFKQGLKQKKGLNIIEAMVAIAVLAIILVSVYAIFNQGYSYMRKTRMATTAYFLAQSKLEEYYSPSKVSSLPTDVARTNFTAPYNEYNWSATFRSPPPGLLSNTGTAEVNVTVYWPGATGERSISLVVLMPNA